MNLPKRKAMRLVGYNYSLPGMYFLTVCVKDRKHLLGKIVRCGDFDAPKMMLSEYGKILDKYICLMDKKYKHIKVDKYVIMPNHFHLILNVNGYKTEGNGLSASAKPYNSEVSKFISLLKRLCNREYGRNIWLTSYYDHIIRDEKDYLKIWQYIDSNANKWEFDCYY